MLKETKWKFKIKPKTLGGDKEYVTGEFIRTTIFEGVVPRLPVMGQNDKGIYSIDKFEKRGDTFICPKGKRTAGQSFEAYGLSKNNFS